MISSSTYAGNIAGDERGRRDRSTSPAGPCSRYRLTYRCIVCRDTPKQAPACATVKSLDRTSDTALIRISTMRHIP